MSSAAPETGARSAGWERFVLAFSISVGVSLGTLPYLHHVARLRYAPFVALVFFLLAMVLLRDFRSPASQAPSAGEYALATWNASFWGGVLSLVTLGFHWTAFGVWHVVAWIARLLERPIETEPTVVAIRISTFMLIVFGFGVVSEATKELSKKLHPATAGARSPYFPFLGQHKRLWALIGVTAVSLALMFLLFDTQGTTFKVLLLFWVIFATVTVENLGTDPEKSRQSPIVETIARLLNAAGYETVVAPRTGRQDVDPLLKTIDLLASSQDRSLAIAVKPPRGKAEPVEWHEASLLQSAGRTLKKFLQEESPEWPVQSVLVLVDREIDDSLRAFSTEQDVPVVQLTSAELAAVEAESDVGELRRIAGEHGLELAGPPIATGAAENAGAVNV